MQRALVVAVVAVVSACAESRPYVKPFYFVVGMNGEPMGRIVQTERPTTCAGTAQPAIIDFERSERVPVWGCFAACKPGMEPVTYALALSGSSPTELSTRCEPVCPPETHRRSYIELERTGEQHCEPGAPPSAQTAEQARIKQDYDARQNKAYTAADALVADVESRPRPWDNDAWYADTQASRAVEEFAGRWSDAAAAERLKKRLDALKDERKKASSVRKDRRREEQRRERAHGNCTYERDACANTCRKMPLSVCDQCKRDFDACEAAIY